MGCCRKCNWPSKFSIEWQILSSCRTRCRSCKSISSKSSEALSSVKCESTSNEVQSTTCAVNHLPLSDSLTTIPRACARWGHKGHPQFEKNRHHTKPGEETASILSSFGRPGSDCGTSAGLPCSEAASVAVHTRNHTQFRNSTVRDQEKQHIRTPTQPSTPQERKH